jgi:hypothetical protein
MGEKWSLRDVDLLSMVTKMGGKQTNWYFNSNLPNSKGKTINCYTLQICGSLFVVYSEIL